MLGRLPKTLNVHGKDYPIRSDFRDVFNVLAAYNAPELSNQEKVFVCLSWIFPTLREIPKEDYEEAYNRAAWFIECGVKGDDKPSPKIIDWDKDEQMMFSAVNKVAGCEIRELPYLHWWTFVGYFQNIERESTWGFVLSIRQKLAKRKKLEKYEQEFYNANRSLIEAGDVVPKTKSKAQDDLERIFMELSAERK